MNEQPKDSSYLERLAALNLLRENIFYSNPKKYTFTDVAEDLPGAFRTIAPTIKNILPSYAIISKDPEIRRQQLQEAANKIRNSKESKKGLVKEILTNVKNMGLGAVVPSFLLSSVFNILGFRNPITKNHLNKTILRSPVTPIDNIKKVINTPGYREAVLRDATHDAAVGAGLGAAAGAAYPLFSHGANISDKAIEDAQKIMQENPYITSLPGSEIVSAIKTDGTPTSDKNNFLNKLKQMATTGGIGAGAGALLGGLHAVSPALIKALGLGLRNAFTKRPLSQDIPQMFSSNLPKDIRLGASFGAGAGLLGGALTKKMKDSNEA